MEEDQRKSEFFESAFATKGLKIVVFCLPFVVGGVAWLGGAWIDGRFDTIEARASVNAEKLEQVVTDTSSLKIRASVLENNQQRGHDDRVASDAAMNLKLDKIIDGQMLLMQDVAALKAVQPRHQ